jgi:hypothetical protein
MTSPDFRARDLITFPVSTCRLSWEWHWPFATRVKGQAFGTIGWLVPEGFVHQKFISDLAGFDPPAHDQTPAKLIKAIAGWLTIQPDYSPPTPSPRAIFAAHPRLAEHLE